MRYYGDVRNIEKVQLQLNWSNESGIADAYVKFKEQFIKILLDFESMQGRRLAKINTARHEIKLFSAKAKPIFSARHQVASNAGEFAKNGIDNKSYVFGKVLSSRPRPNGQQR